MNKSAIGLTITCLVLSVFLFTGMQNINNNTKEVDSFLQVYNKTYTQLNAKANEADWKANTHIVEGDTSISGNVQRSKEALAAFTGSKLNIEKARTFLADKKSLTEIQVKQLERILYLAGNNPEVAGDLVKQRITAEAKQVEKLFGFQYEVAGKPVSTNDIDRMLSEDTDLDKRLMVWKASKEVGKNLKSGLVNLRNLRNKTVQTLGYKDFFSYQASEYGMSREEMMELLRGLNKQLYPLFRELHTYARYELAKKYDQKDIPDYIPAHWLPNRWGQDWSSLVNVKGIDLDEKLKAKKPEWIVQQAEGFYKSLGFQPLPAFFWTKSDLYPLSPTSAYKKNNHASAWHMDYNQDVRSLMSVEPNAEWYETTHHELGHIYYYLSYSTPAVPPTLREGANRAFHEAMGSMIGLAATQKPFLVNRGLVKANTPTDDMQLLLKEALHYVVFIPWSAGVMSEYENSLYGEGLDSNKFNSYWWELCKQYQGIVPGEERGEKYCDAATKTHINDDPAQYYDYALSYVVLFQLHDYIAKNILKQDPHATNYYGNKQVGEFLKQIMAPGASQDWQVLIKNATKEPLSARAMLDYFEPLMAYLKGINHGRKYTLPEA